MRTCYALAVLARLLIVSMCVGFPLVAALAPSDVLAALGPEWAWAALAGALAVVAGVVSGARVTSAILGGLMLAVGTHQAPLLTEGPWMAPGEADSWPHYDLTASPLPEDAEGFVRVEGFIRPSMQLREFQVATGERPDQNQAAHAVLMPLVGTSAGVIEVEGRVVIARVPERVRKGPERVLLSGALVPPPVGVSDVLIELGDDASGDVRAVMLDTTRTGYNEQPWVTAILVGLTLLFAAGQLWPRKRDED
jgi:hypothetical protein